MLLLSRGLSDRVGHAREGPSWSCTDGGTGGRRGWSVSHFFMVEARVSDEPIVCRNARGDAVLFFITSCWRLQKGHVHSVVWPRCRPSWGQARRAGGRECSRRDVRRRSASFASGCQPEREEVMDARSAAVDFRSRRGRPGASPPTPSKASVVAGVIGEGRPSAAFPYCAFSMRRTRDSP